MTKRAANRKMTLHAPGTGEHALCGLAFDAYDSGYADEPVVFAEPGQTVTCDYCRLQIEHVRRGFRGYRVLPNASQTISA